MYEGKDVQELYVFEDENDPECPIIMHFVLVNKDFRLFKKPGKHVYNSNVPKTLLSLQQNASYLNVL